MALSRLYSHYIAEQSGPDTWAGKLVFCTPEAEAELTARQLYNTLMPGHVGKYPAKCKRVKVFHEAEEGKAYIACYYQTTRVPGKATLVGNFQAKRTPVTHDLDGKPINGPDDKGQWYQLKTGAAIRSDAIEVVTLKTAVNDSDLDVPAYRAVRGHVNDNDLPSFGNAPAGSLLLESFSYRWEWGEDLWYLDYHFLVCPETDDGNVLAWNDITTAQAGVWLAQESDVYIPVANTATKDWAKTGGKREAMRFHPNLEMQTINGVETLVESAPEKRRMFKEASFSDLDAMVEW